MARKWSKTARRDFAERKEYRKERGEKDRYKKGYSDRSEDSPGDEDRRKDEKEATRYDRLAERGWDNFNFMSPQDRESTLMQIRNAGPDDDVDDALERLREEYEYYEMELDDYDADYDRVVKEMEDLKRDNRRYMMREGKEIETQQDDDIKLDGKYPKSYESLWDEREG